MTGISRQIHSIANLQKMAVAERRKEEPTTGRRNEVGLAVGQATIELLAEICRLYSCKPTTVSCRSHTEPLRPTDDAIHLGEQSGISVEAAVWMAALVQTYVCRSADLSSRSLGPLTPKMHADSYARLPSYTHRSLLSLLGCLPHLGRARW